MAEGTEKIVIRTKLGEREIARNSIITFPHGLIGMGDRREFALIPLREGSPFLLLQCVTEPDLGLLVADPFPFLPGYGVTLAPAERKLLCVKDTRSIAVLVTVSIPPGRPQDTTFNLVGPIVLNTEARLGVQAPQVNAGDAAHVRLADLPQQRKARAS